MFPRNQHAPQAPRTGQSRIPLASERLESLEAAMVVARRHLETLPKLSTVLLARTAAERALIEQEVDAAASWVASTTKELTENEKKLSPRSEKLRSSALRTEAEALQAIVRERAERMRAAWGARACCPDTVPKLSASDLRQLSNDMTALRQEFWARLYSFPGIARKRMLTLRRCLAGELKPASAFYTKRSDPRHPRDLLAESVAVLEQHGLREGSPGKQDTARYDSRLGAALARLPSLPERALEASTELQAKAATLEKLYGLPSSDAGRTEAEVAALEAHLGDRTAVHQRMLELIEARDRYLTLKTYIFASNIGFADKLAKELVSRPSASYRDDIHQASRLGLLKAVERWDPDVGSTFATLAKWWIEEMARSERRNATADIKMPDHALRLLHALRRLADGDLRSLDADTAAQSFGVEPTTFLGVRTVAIGIKRLNDFLGASNKQRELGAAIADHRTSEAEQQREAQEAKELTTVLMRRLSSRERDILCLRFGLNGSDEGPMPLREIADRFGITRERARQICAQALSVLRQDSRIN